MAEQSTATHDQHPSGSAWGWLLAVALVVLVLDLLLGLGHEEREPPPVDELAAAELRTRLKTATAAAKQGRPAIVLVGDSVLAGDVMASRVPDWQSQRVIDHMRAELGTDSDALLQQIAFDGLLPVDALRVLAELDRIDPTGEVRFVLELNLRYFSWHYAKQRDCTRVELCELGRTRAVLGHGEPNPWLLALGGVVESAELARDWLRRRTPIHRHRPHLRRPELAQLDGLAVARPDSGDSDTRGPTHAEGLARVQAHYRELSLPDDHAQVEALIELVERLRVRGRSAALFLTPLEDEFVAATLHGNELGRQYERLAALIHDRASLRSATRAKIELLDLDHPLFGSHHFLDHVHLGPEGNRLLALNLLHELGLPLRVRPFDSMMVHHEDHDRSLVHRRGSGFADGGAWQALFRVPDGVAVSRSGDWIVIADTANQVLRQLRGSMQIVERLAGTPRRTGAVDGPASTARLDQPRSPQIVGDAVYFLDGRKGSRVRALIGGVVETLRWSGPRCDGYRELEAHATTLFLLCADDRVLLVDPDRRVATLGFDPRRHPELVGLRGLEPTHDGRLLLADRDSRIWAVALDHPGRAPTLLFDNAAPELLPRELGATYPYSFAELRLNRIVAMEWVERHGALLIQDEHELVQTSSRLTRETTERVHLRLLDLDHGLVYPWIKAIPHAEAFHMWNETTQSLVSYFHLGSMAVVQDDASLVYLERSRSRLFRIADGLLAAAKTGNVHTEHAKIQLLQPIDTDTASLISATIRPDRWLGTRHEPIPRAGPYVALLIGSSLSAISDRLGNYALGRLLELELQAELGYRDGVRLDLYQRTLAAPSLATTIDALEDFLDSAGPPPDIVLLELHLHAIGEDQRAQLARLEELAARHDTLLIFYDNSALEADERDGLRASRPSVRALIDDIRGAGFEVLEPSDRLLRELLVESPWGNQPWGEGLHHGAPWAVELTAKSLASSAYPLIREFLRGRTPARERSSMEGQ